MTDTTPHTPGPTTGPASADGSGRAPIPVRVQEVLDRAVAEQGFPGYSVQIRQGERSSFGAAGFADTGSGRERLPQERFRIGSTTKTFAAILLLRLEAEGVLSLDDTVETWLPDLVRGNGNDGRSITLEQLLSMTSGLFNYVLDEDILVRFNGPGFLEHRFDSFTPEELVRTALAHPPEHSPGQGWNYCNTGYFLAGMIIERATGQTFARQVEQHLARPLGLTSTYVPGEEKDIPGTHARHYSRLYASAPDAPVYDVTELNASAAWAAGGMVSSTTDLNHFFAALLRGDLLPPAQQARMFTTAPTPEGKWLPIPDTTYGLGMSSLTLAGGDTVWGMGGAINGSFCFTYGTRDGGLVISQSINCDWGNPIGAFAELLDTALRSPSLRPKGI
ncbi:beta-lactamase family protein [Nocardiopsis exhalans]|uniref:Beta-lactamase family protein n=1 Tax=Nocardiopsis exhalans TaxID=163604 RepID=A0ABY5DE91_9ACTN|nr:serine hydrolase domain-containing protein [Nocardiopsis exhalans]USY21432.1 beta-lactamase family protein [Nocardiopsis exhalans]